MRLPVAVRGVRRGAVHRRSSGTSRFRFGRTITCFLRQDGNMLLSRVNTIRESLGAIVFRVDMNGPV